MTQHRTTANGLIARGLAGVIAVLVFGGIALYATQGEVAPITMESDALPYSDAHPIDHCMMEKREEILTMRDTGEYSETMARRALAGLGNACAAAYGSERETLARSPRWGNWYGAVRNQP